MGTDVLYEHTFSCQPSLSNDARSRLKDVGAAQPFDPISLWEMWPAEGEIWVALG